VPPTIVNQSVPCKFERKIVAFSLLVGALPPLASITLQKPLNYLLLERLDVFILK
jgi:hypothetical protein